MGGDPANRNKQLRCSYHKDHGYRIEKCNTLKQLLESLVRKGGHLAGYVKGSGKGEKKDTGSSSDEGQLKRPANRVVTGHRGNPCLNKPKQHNEKCYS